MLSRLRSCLIPKSDSRREESTKSVPADEGPWFTLGNAEPNQHASRTLDIRDSHRRDAHGSRMAESDSVEDLDLELEADLNRLPATTLTVDGPAAYSGDVSRPVAPWSDPDEDESQVWSSSYSSLADEDTDLEGDVFAAKDATTTESGRQSHSPSQHLPPGAQSAASASRTSHADFDWQQAVATLFAEIRPEIKRLIARHLDRRLIRRVDPSDVAQSAFIDAQEKLTRFLRERPMEVHRWLFFLAKMKTLETNQHHLNSRKRSVRLEADIPRSVMAGAAHYCTATSPSQALSRKETKEQLKWAISQLPDHYQQIIELRHMRGLTNAETSQILELTENATSKLYGRALNALQKELRGSV